MSRAGRGPVVTSMARVSAIELGVDSCVIARVRVVGDTTQVSRVYGLRAEEAALPDSGRAEYLRSLRREHGFPRHARVVAWRLPPNGSVSASATDPATRLVLAPLLEAGFTIDAAMSPPEALALLARQRPRPAGRAGAAWLSLNTHAAAIAIVNEGELLFSRVFDWNYRPAATLREELLQRYSLVAHLAPELRHGFDIVRAQHGATVDAIITCGDLPDLRSLTMPLIEELDMEVETLDSLDGLQIVPPARAEEIADRAPALRLATAAAARAGTVSVRDRAPLLVAAAAVIALVASVIWAATQSAGRTTTPPEAVGPSSQPRSEVARTSPPPPAAVKPSTPPAQQPTAPRAPDRGRDNADANIPAATTGRTPAPSAARSPRASAPASAPASGERRIVPLHAPLPTVNSILVSPERRLAVVDGVIVHEGEAVGPRVLIRIEPDAVVLKEPSGYEVRVPIRRRIEPATGL